MGAAALGEDKDITEDAAVETELVDAVEEDVDAELVDAVEADEPDPERPRLRSFWLPNSLGDTSAYLVSMTCRGGSTDLER